VISFIIAYKQDTEERSVNLEYCKRYYNQLVPDCEIIIKESPNVNFNKCKLYNKGALEATHDTLCFLDSDVFVSEYSIRKSIELANSNNVIIGYNGVAIYLSYKAKNTLTSNLTYKNMLDILPKKYSPVKLEKTEMFEVGNLKAVGGCLIMSKDCFNNVNGFNPNFINWGYEDNEIVTRCHKLKKNVILVNTKDPYLFHLPHHNVEEDKSIHEHYNSNRLEYMKVNSMNYLDLKDYIKTWKL
tara:strand:+ start:1470 stop:2195 length:726 start_codon:yes stop_codon:yes gene_type:complete